MGCCLSRESRHSVWTWVCSGPALVESRTHHTTPCSLQCDIVPLGGWQKYYPLQTPAAPAFLAHPHNQRVSVVSIRATLNIKYQGCLAAGPLLAAGDFNTSAARKCFLSWSTGLPMSDVEIESWKHIVVHRWGCGSTRPMRLSSREGKEGVRNPGMRLIWVGSQPQYL